MGEVNFLSLTELASSKCLLLSLCAFFLGGGSGAIVIHHFSMVSFVAYTGPNSSRVGAIDNPGLFEQVFDYIDIPEVPEKILRTTFRCFVVKE